MGRSTRPLNELGRIFTDADGYADPERWHAAAATLRRDEPVCRVESPVMGDFWAVTRHADVMEVERQPDLFPNTRDAVLLPVAELERMRQFGVDLKTLIHMDGQEHTDYRKVTSDWFKPASLRRLSDTIEGIAAEFAERLVDLGGECDFAVDIAMPYPLHVIMSILGVPPEDEPLMLRVTQSLFSAQDSEFGGDDPLVTTVSAVMEFWQYFVPVVKDRQTNPTADLATVIANGRIGDEPLGDIEMMSYYVIVASAGHDTTSSSMAGGMEALLRHPDQLQALRDDPDLVPGAVEEMIRWSSPVRHFLRHATADTEVGGESIAAGDRLLLSYWSANRDDAVFDDPFAFDIGRENADRHLAFGFGVHHCLGAQLARMELRAYLRALLARVESIELVGEPEWTSATFVGGVKHLPIRYTLR